MVGEIVTGAVGAAASAVQAVSPVIEAPMVAASALPAVMDVPVAAAEVVGGFAEVAPTLAEAPLSGAAPIAGSVGASISPVVEVAQEATAAVHEAVGVLGPVEQLVADVIPPADSTALVGELHMFLRQNDAAGALEFLAYGKLQQAGGFAEAGQGGIDLDAALLDLQKMLPENAQHIVNTVQGIQIPDSMKNDPEFLEKFMSSLQEDLAVQTGGDAKQRASALQSHINSSARKAMQQNEASKLTERDLEKLKKESAKKAALLAIREYMNRWRESVETDKRLDEHAKQLAQNRINLVEAKLLTQEAMKWDGVSIVKLVVLAYVFMKEMQEESLPQPKL